MKNAISSGSLKGLKKELQLHKPISIEIRQQHVNIECVYPHGECRIYSALYIKCSCGYEERQGVFYSHFGREVNEEEIGKLETNSVSAHSLESKCPHVGFPCEKSPCFCCIWGDDPDTVIERYRQRGYRLTFDCKRIWKMRECERIEYIKNE